MQMTSLGSEKLGMAAAPKVQNEVVSVLKGFPFFERFPEELLLPLSRLAHYKVVASGDLLLEQGQINFNLYILVNGKAQVLVEGAPVAELDKPGDLIGEMSLITGRPASATIMGLSDLEVYALNVRELSQLSGESQDRLQHLLYRIYSQVLSQRLEMTNDKAKRLEITAAKLEQAREDLEELNRGLEEKVAARTTELKHRNSELVLSYRKLEELYSNRKGTMGQLQELYNNHLLPLAESLKIRNGKPPEARELDNVRSEVMQTISRLEPISRLYSSELAMRSHRVLILDANRKQQVVAKMALGGTGVDLEVAPDIEVARKLVAAKKFHILFISSELLSFAEEFRSTHPESEVVLMTSQPIPEYLTALSRLSFMPNVVSRSDEDRTFTVKNTATTVAKLASGDIFGLEKYLSWGVEVAELSVRASDERESLIGRMRDHFAALGIRSTNLDRASVVAEELLMNAIYDAPIDDNGISIFNHLDRTTKVQLKPEQYARLRYASDGMLATISVEDPFGALEGSTILKYLESCYGNRAGSLNAKKGGAGRGLHQIVENSDLVVFNLQPGRRTEVIALFNIDPNASKVDYPTFHLFML